MTFLCMIALRNKTVARTFLQSFVYATGRLYQERLLRSRHFATVVAWRHTSLRIDHRLTKTLEGVHSQTICATIV